ncbi:sensor domain-containing diguanylate cyclase [Maridesulfovibrio sp. FT414]|uniref:sensor domain-containing diguanylate cyclase n=1 Tax=Maridesulfovibrio sp. FT414 TaxID=2979469 RepID=UPI003D803D7E
MREFYDGKSVRLTILLILLISLVGIVGGFKLYFDSLDRLSEENLKQRVFVSLEIEAERQQEMLEEYSFWDEAYEKIISSLDWHWIKLNTGDYLINKLGIDFSMGVLPDGSLAYVAAKDSAASMKYASLLEGGLDNVLEASRNSISTQGIVSGYVALDGDVYLISAGPFIDESTAEPRPDFAYLILGRKLDSGFLQYVSNKYKLPDLVFSTQCDASGNVLSLIGQDGKFLGCLVWERYRPSLDILPRLVVIVFAFYAVTVCLCWTFLRREAMSIKEEEEKLYFMATKDYLTGISNRRHVMTLGQRMLSTHRKCGRRLSVLLLDIDCFKAINDEYGHEIGDKALSYFAQVCAKKLRSSDLFGRFGGEEFIAVLHDTDSLQAMEVTERIRSAVESAYADTTGTIPDMTVSIGVATDAVDTDFEGIIKNADQALYQAKSTGRNRVVLFDPDNS